MKPPSRRECKTGRNKTSFGTIHTHIETDAKNNRVIGVRFSFPQKFEDTEVGDLLDSLSEKATRLVQMVGGYDD